MKKFSFKIKKNEAIRFSKISNDTNPIHLNHKAARLSIHGRNISHGILLVLKTFSKINNIKNYFKGNYSINIKFLKPTFYDEEIKVLYLVKKKNLKIEIYQNEKIICTINIYNFSIKSNNMLTKSYNYTKKNKKINSNVKDKINDLKMVLNQISYYVGVTHVKKSGIINEINIYSKALRSKISSKVVISSKKIDKRFQIYNNILSSNGITGNFISSKNLDFKIIKHKNNSESKQILKKISSDIVVVSGNSALGESFLNLLEENNKIKILVSYSSKIYEKKNKKNILYHKIILPEDLNRLFNLIKKLNNPYIFYFTSPPIDFGKELSKNIVRNYYKIYVDIPLLILNNKQLKIKKFIYPSTTNINYDKDSIYSKTKLIAENKLKKMKNCKIFRFGKIYSRNTISLYDNKIINFQKFLNENPKYLKGFFQ